MGRLFSVKLPLTAVAWIAAFFLSAGSLCAAEPPDARELLRMARLTQGEQDLRLIGQLRVGAAKQPFRLVLEKGAIRYEFLDNGDAITLRLGEKGSTLEEKRGGKTAKVTPARFDDPVRGTDIRYEDIALRFLYWTDAKVIGDDMISARSCWKVEVRPPAKAESQYKRVVLWIGKQDGALMKAESFDANDNWARRFVVRSVMKREGFWLLKQMRIESANGRKSDPQPTYLEIDDLEK
jgi:hypothetical protein